MDFLMRDENISAEMWQNIDNKVVAVASTILTGRRFLDIFGPLGVGVQTIKACDVCDHAGYLELADISEDFVITWKELEYAKAMGIPVSLAKAASAAAKCAKKEDQLIFLGDEEGHEGLLNAEGTLKCKLDNWNKGENAFKAIVEGLQHMLENDTYGEKVLVVSPDVYASLQHIQTGTGTLESKRIAALIEGKILQTPVLPAKTALLIATGEQNMDLVIGQDLVTAYLGAADLNHEFRILETAVLRIKNKNAIVVYQG